MSIKKSILCNLKKITSKQKLSITKISLSKNLQESQITHPSLSDRQEEYGDQKMVLNQFLFKIQSKQKMLSSFHQFIGAIVFNFKDEQGEKFGCGSAILISENVILTAAHNIYTIGLGRHYNFKFYLAPFGDVVMDKYYTIQFWRFPKQYESTLLSQKGFYDYGIGKLKQFIPKNNFCELNLTCVCCQIPGIQQMQLQIYGYPLNKTNYKIKDSKCTIFQLYQFGLSLQNKLQFINYNNGAIAYKISTLGGHSGSPVINNKKIIAIHNGEAKKQKQFNIGRLITKDVILNLDKWVKELQGNRFYINQKTVCLHYKNDKSFLELVKYIKKDILNITFENQVRIIQILGISKQIIGEQLIIDCYKLPSLGILSSLNSVILMLLSAVSFKKSIIKLSSSNPSLIFHKLIANVFSDITQNQSLQKKKKSLISVAQHMQNKNNHLLILVINDAISCLLQVLNLLQEEDANNSKLNYFKINYEPRCCCKQGGMLQCYLVKSGQSCITCKSQIKYRILNSGPYLIAMPSKKFKLQNYIKLVNKDNNEMFYQNKSFISHHKDYKGGYYMCHRITEQGWIQTKDQSAKLVSKIQNITVTPIMTLYEFIKRKAFK